MRYNNYYTRIAASIVNGACGLLFCVFTVFYLGKWQRDVLAAGYFVRSGASGEYNCVAATAITSILAFMLGCVTLSVLKFHIKVKALAWMPSFLVIGALTSMTVSADSGLDFPVLRIVMWSVITLVVLAVCFLTNETSSEHNTTEYYLATNLLALGMLMLMTLHLGNTDTLMHRELRMARCLKEGDFHSVLSMRENQEHHSRNTVAMQVLAFARSGRLADELFTVRGLEGSGSMMPGDGVTMQLYSTRDLLYRHLALAPKGSGSPDLAWMLECAVRDTLGNGNVHDYYLCSLLLNRKLRSFARILPRYYAIDSTLPRAYAEALVLLQRRSQTAVTDEQGRELPLMEGTAAEENYEDFMRIFSAGKNGSPEQRAACFEMHPDTYWYYFFFLK